MTPNIALEREQAQRLLNDSAAVEAENDRESELYADGDWDGRIGNEPNPEHWSSLSYRAGWLNGVGHYYDRKFGTKLEVL